MSFSAKLKKRREKFKQTSKNEQSIQSREKLTYQISKKNKENKLKAKRRYKDQLTEFQKLELDQLDRSEIREKIIAYSNTLKQNRTGKILEIVRDLKNYTCITNDPPLDIIVNSSLVPSLVRLLEYEFDFKVQLNVAVCLSNISSTNTYNINCLYSDGCIEGFLKLLLNNENPELLNIAILTLGNFAHESVEYRDKIVEYEVIPHLSEIFERINNVQVRKTILRAISHMVKYRSKPPFVQLEPFFLYCFKIIDMKLQEFLKKQKTQQGDFTIESLWTLSYLSSGSSSHRDFIIQNDILSSIVKLLEYGITGAHVPSLRILSNISSGSEEQVQAVIESGVLKLIKLYLGNVKSKLRFESCWLLSNICSGTAQQIRSVFDPNIISLLISILKNDSQDICLQASYVVYNIICLKNPDQIEFFKTKGLFKALCDCLNIDNADLLYNTLGIIEIVLQIESETETELKDNNSLAYIKIFERYGVIELIEKLIDYPNERISSSATFLIDNYFYKENTKEIENDIELDFD
ncbi:importin subunit alpha-4 [Anaeramoeba flamelloides]|uniref:Importin subunit alpha n=1 Tax=Anaeramoeba flamelloides TaxID=1746091 RepID=A0AAV8AF50_9EUKA|nr:importin subunit alpha-4 [Anaeramoeba flamelloides]